MKRLLNYRPLLIMFVGLALGIYGTNELFVSNYIKAVAIFVMAFIIIGVLATRSKKSAKINRAYLIFTLSLFAGICMLVGVVGKAYNTQSKLSLENGRAEINIEGRVKNVDNDKIIIENVSSDGVYYKGINIQLLQLENQSIVFEVGDIIQTIAVVFDNDIINVGESINTSVLLKRIYFTGYISSSEVNINHGGTNVFETISIKTDALLKENMSEQAYGVSKALLLGDKSNLDDYTYTGFQLSGLAHVLSISGLHVGFIVSLLGFVLKKLKSKKIVNFGINALFLLFYCCLCGFVSSVVRASVMSLVLLSSFIFYRQPDHLSSLSFAGLILTCINPAYLLEIGFKLSFGAVFGIMLFATPLTRILTKIKLPNFLASTFAVTIAAEIATFPIIAKYFGYIAPISLISNLVILPIFSALFCVLFVLFLFNLIFGFGWLYFVMGHAITSLCSLTSMLSQCWIIKLSSLGDITESIYYFALFAISGFVMLKPKVKNIVNGILCGIIVISIILSNLPTTFDSEKALTFNNFPNSILLTSSNNQRVLVGAGTGEEYEVEKFTSYLTRLKINHIDMLVIPSYTATLQQNIASLVSEFNIKNVYIPTITSDQNIFGLTKVLPSWATICTFEDELSLSFVDISCVEVNNTVKAVEINFSDFNILLIQNILTDNQATKLLPKLQHYPNTIIAEKNYDGISVLFNNFSKSNIILKDITKGLPSGNNAQVLVQKMYYFAQM